MITFSSKIKAIIAANKAETFVYLSIKNGDGSLFRAATTHHSSFTADDNLLYVSDDFIVGIDPPQQSSSVDREQYKLTLADPTFRTAAAAENGLVGKKVEVRLGFVDPDTGLPLANVTDSLVIYKGKVDGLIGTAETEEAGDLNFVMSCASPMVSLDQSKGLYLSRDQVRARNPNDSSCDEIYTGSGSITIKWGRS